MAEVRSEDRRRFFRIDDELALSWHVIDPAEAEARIQDFWENEHAFSIRNNYNFQIEQQLADFQRIENKMPELARYLSVLEKQVDRLTEKLIVDPADAELEITRVNLSAQGMSFRHWRKPPADALIEVDLKLLPSGQRLVIIGRIVQVDSDDSRAGEDYRIALDFEHLHEADREILIKHIHGKQMESLSSAQET